MHYGYSFLFGLLGVAVVSTSPSDGATDVPKTASVSATFSEDVSSSTITASAFTLATDSTSVSGSLSCSSSTRTATFTPSQNLSYSTTYTAAITTDVQDLACNPMTSDYSWTFTTEGSPLPAFPLSSGTRWQFQVDKTWGYISGWDWSSSSFEGDYVLFVVGDVFLEGKDATKLLLVEIPRTRGGFDASYIYLAQDGEGLHKCSGPGNAWKTILSSQSLSFSNNTFLFAGAPLYSAPSEMSVAQITIPAGTFDVLKVEHHYSQTDQYAPEDIFADNYECYAHLIGLVKSSWSYSFDDNDPMGTDLFNNGTIDLEYMDTAPIPELFIESEPNDSWLYGSLTLTDVPSVVIGDTMLGDASELINDPNVYQNNNGDQVINDWHKFSIPVGQSITLNLKFEHSDNDIDLYLFQELPGPTLCYLARSTNPQGEKEQISLFLGSGTYYIGIQAWVLLRNAQNTG